MALFFLLNILDAASTYWLYLLAGNNNDGELNPLGRWLMNQGWGYAILFKFAGVMVILAGIIYIYKNNEKVAVWAINIFIIVFVLVVANNTIAIGCSL